MAGRQRKKVGRRLLSMATKKAFERRQYRYFYIDNKLHKLMKVNRVNDEALTWCYTDHCRKIYPWSDVKRTAQRGFSISQAAKILNRTPRMIKYYIENWGLDYPEKTYSLTTGNPGMGIFSEDYIDKLLTIMGNTHLGRPRKDGFIRSRRMPDRREVRAAVKYDLQLYAKNRDGEFVPVYEAEEW